MTFFRSALVVAAACCLHGESTYAQAREDKRPRATGPTRVALVAVDSLIGGNPVRVERRIHVRPQDVILVTPSATARDLAAALHVLDGLRHQYGDSLDSSLQASPGNYSPSPTWENSPYQQWMDAQLTRLRGARVFRVQGLGTHRATWITVPAPKGRVRAAIPGRKGGGEN